MKKILHQGDEFKDVVYISTSFKTTFIQRILFLFYPNTKIEVTLYVKEEMPDYKATDFFIARYSYWDNIKNWFYKKFKYDSMSLSTDK